ncbi:MAG: hypothetical protein AB1298_10530 [Bacteroidota bacterium]
MKKKNEVELKRIFADKTSGSSELLEQINIFFRNNFDGIQNKPQLISLLQKKFQTFQNIQDFLEQLKLELNSGQLSEKFFRRFNKEKKTVYDKIFANAYPFLKNKKTILTISNSKTVFEIVKRLTTYNCKLITICESRPGLEGRILAKKLVREKIKVELITEAMIGSYIQKCDAVLIGADSVLRNRDVVNKTGSLQLAVLCKYYKKPFYVVVDKSKFSKKNSFTQNEESVEEIWKKFPKKITVKNFYFEKIPRSLITKIISD